MTADATPAPVRMRDFPGHSIALAYDIDAVAAAQPVSAHVALAALLDLYAAVDALPLTLEVTTSYLNEEFGFPLDDPVRPDSEWALHAERLPPELRIRPRAKNQRMRRSPTLDLSNCLAFVAESLRGSDRDMSPSRVGWRSMGVHACAVRLPADTPLDGGKLPVQVGRGIVRTPVEIREGARWAAGPGSPSMAEAPLECWIAQEYGELDLRVSAYWTPWCPGGSEYPALRRAVDTLVSSGWELTFEG
ncbi:hypothetical protein [Streptomyces sp. NPDC059639]|uniref:hypothetical protein n=1 Tax=Streptomyces sp. NPDC059639 TaxID=3346891 RepID=UPI00369B3019